MIPIGYPSRAQNALRGSSAPQKRHCDTTTKGLGTLLQRFEVDQRKSLTYDQGRERGGHEQLEQDIGIMVYFAHPHSPWERVPNENTNGLLRQCLPKGADLSTYSQEDLDAITWKLNTRPRKS